jgi:hypothetical protein
MDSGNRQYRRFASVRRPVSQHAFTAVVTPAVNDLAGESAFW